MNDSSKWERGWKEWGRVRTEITTDILRVRDMIYLKTFYPEELGVSEDAVTGEPGGHGCADWPFFPRRMYENPEDDSDRECVCSGTS
jgi:hypothetical protein